MLRAYYFGMVTMTTICTLLRGIHFGVSCCKDLWSLRMEDCRVSLVERTTDGKERKKTKGKDEYQALPSQGQRRVPQAEVYVRCLLQLPIQMRASSGV